MCGKIKLKEKFSHSITIGLFSKTFNLRHYSKSVDEYREEFYILQVRWDLRGSEEQSAAPLGVCVAFSNKDQVVLMIQCV